MPLSQVNNGDTGADARTKINAAITQVNTNTTNIATNTGDISTNETTMNNHIADTANPHSVTKTQVGLGNCDNVSDLNKPISTATQTALNLKQDADAADTLYYGLSLGETASRSLLATDYNTLIQFQLAAPATLTFPTGIGAFTIGGCVEVANSDTSTQSITLAAGGGASLYVGAKGTTLAAGVNAAFRRISATEWLRLY